jgi:hypothetical protein
MVAFFIYRHIKHRSILKILFLIVKLASGLQADDSMYVR